MDVFAKIAVTVEKNLTESIGKISSGVIAKRWNNDSTTVSQNFFDIG